MNMRTFAETMISMATDYLKGQITESTYVHNMDVAVLSMNRELTRPDGLRRCGCGAQPEFWTGCGKDGTGAWVECKNCQRRGPLARTKAEAGKLWNEEG